MYYTVLADFVTENYLCHKLSTVKRSPWVLEFVVKLFLRNSTLGREGIGSLVNSYKLSMIKLNGCHFFKQEWNYLDFWVRINIFKWLLYSSCACVYSSAEQW